MLLSELVPALPAAPCSAVPQPLSHRHSYLTVLAASEFQVKVPQGLFPMRRLPPPVVLLDLLSHVQEGESELANLQGVFSFDKTIFIYAFERQNSRGEGESSLIQWLISPMATVGRDGQG